MMYHLRGFFGMSVTSTSSSLGQTSFRISSFSNPPGLTAKLLNRSMSTSLLDKVSKISLSFFEYSVEK